MRCFLFYYLSNRFDNIFRSLAILTLIGFRNPDLDFFLYQRECGKAKAILLRVKSNQRDLRRLSLYF